MGHGGDRGGSAEAWWWCCGNELGPHRFGSVIGTPAAEREVEEAGGRDDRFGGELLVSARGRDLVRSAHVTFELGRPRCCFYSVFFPFSVFFLFCFLKLEQF
jgi:hypothetical protein